MKKKYIIIISFIFLILGMIFAWIKPISSLETQYLVFYDTLLIVYFIMGSITLSLLYIKKVEFFEPISYIALIYLFIFSITPMIDLVQGNIYFLGNDLWIGCIKASTFFILGYFSFLIGYFIVGKTKNIKKNKYNTIRITKISEYIWVFCFLLSLIFLLSSGKNLAYIFSFGTKGEIVNTNESGITGFLSMFSYSLIPTWMILYNNKNYNKIKLFFMGVFTMMIYYIRGFRFIILIFVLAIFVYNYIKTNTVPKIRTLIILGFILAIMIGAIGYSRNNIRSGEDVNWSEFEVQNITDAILGNFRIYQPFYGMVENIPKNYNYTMGTQLSYTLTMFVPRMIWPNKPTTPAKEVLQHSVNEYSVLAGSAYPNIGEYYSEFGLFGVIVLMFIFGLGCKVMYRLVACKNEKNDFATITYCIFLPTLFQLIIRAYTPGNFYLLLFLLAPIKVIEISGRYKR